MEERRTPKPRAQTETNSHHPDLGWVSVKAATSRVDDAVRFAVDDEAMKRVIRPPHDTLDDMMKISNGGMSLTRGDAAR